MAAGVKRGLVLLAVFCFTGCASPSQISPPTISKAAEFSITEVEDKTFKEIALKNKSQCSSQNSCSMIMPMPIIKTRSDIDGMSLVELEKFYDFLSEKIIGELIYVKIKNGKIRYEGQSYPVSISCHDKHDYRSNADVKAKFNLGQHYLLEIWSPGDYEETFIPFMTECRRRTVPFFSLNTDGYLWYHEQVLYHVQKRIDEEKKTLAGSKRFNNQLSNIENSCKTFGYKKGTEKFADCMKDLYLKEAGGSGTASAAQIEALRQQTEAMRKQAEAAERARQSEALMKLGTSLMNPGMNQGQTSIRCTTLGNITNCDQD